MVNWFGNPIATAPAIIVILWYGWLGSRTGFVYPRWFSYALFWLGCTAPLTYFFHQAAHTPEEDRGSFINLLQRWNLALSPELHKVHHRMPNGTWSVMVGWMDWVPNLIYNNLELSTDSARTTCLFVGIIVLLPWYMWLLCFTYEELAARQRAACSSKKQV